MTVKDALKHLGGAQEVSLSWDGNAVSFNFHNAIEVEVWGDYEVKAIYAIESGHFDLILATNLIRKAVTA